MWLTILKCIVSNSAESCTNGLNRNQEAVKILDEQEHEQSHPLKTAKFCLASLLTSSCSDTSYSNTSISTAHEITKASLPDTHQSSHNQDTLIFPPAPPLHNTSLLTNQMKAHISKFSSTEKSLHPECKISHQQFTKANISDNESGKNCERSFGSKILSSKGDSEHSVNDSTEACTPSADNLSTRTKTVGLMDLLTTAVEDKDSSLIMDSSEDKWISPQSLKEVHVC